MNFPDLDLDDAPELAQLETLQTATIVLLAVLDHQYALLEDEYSYQESCTLTAARNLARRARALLAAVRRYRTAIDDRRQCELPF